MASMIDIDVSEEATCFLLTPYTHKGRAWFQDNFDDLKERAHGCGVIVEFAEIEGVLEAIQTDGVLAC